MADLSSTVRYFSTIISLCFQFTSTTTIKISPCRARWGKKKEKKSQLICSGAKVCACVWPRYGGRVCGTVLGSEVNGRPSGGLSLSPRSERALQAAITFLHPPLLATLQRSSHWMCPPTKLGIMKIYKHTLKWSEKVERETAAATDAPSNRYNPRPPRFPSMLTRIFQSNVNFSKKRVGHSTPVQFLSNTPFIWRISRQISVK